MNTKLVKSIFSDDPEMIRLIEDKEQKQVLKELFKSQLQENEDSEVEIKYLRGKKGEKGDTGEPGVSIQGPQGERGEDGKSIVGPQGPKGDKGDTATPVNSTTVIREEVKISEDAVRDIIRIMKALPEKDRLEIMDIRNSQSFMFNGKKYKTEELMHGGGSSAGASANVITEYSLVATPSGSDAVVALSQLTHFATFTNVIAAMRNQIPQTNGVTATITATDVTFINADAGEVFSITYAYS